MADRIIERRRFGVGEVGQEAQNKAIRAREDRRDPEEFNLLLKRTPRAVESRAGYCSGGCYRGAESVEQDPHIYEAKEMMMIKKLIGCAFVIGSFASCGGGGGGSDNSGNGNEPAFLAGVYSGTLSLISNDCGVSLTTQEPFRWTVNQDGEAIVLESAKGETFTGSVLDDSRFATQKDTTTGQCVGKTTITVSSITDNAADTRAEFSFLCGNRTCAVLYTGSATRRTN